MKVLEQAFKCMLHIAMIAYFMIITFSAPLIAIEGYGESRWWYLSYIPIFFIIPNFKKILEYVSSWDNE